MLQQRIIDTLNLILLATYCMVSFKIHLHWTVIRDFGRGNFTETEKIKTTLPGKFERCAASPGKFILLHTDLWLGNQEYREGNQPVGGHSHTQQPL